MSCPTTPPEPPPDPVHESKLCELLSNLAARVEMLVLQNEQLKLGIAALTQEVTELRAATEAPSSSSESLTDDGGWAYDAGRTIDDDRPGAAFWGEITDYEPGLLFEEAAFDLTLSFDRLPGVELAKQWGFENAGHLLHALLATGLRLFADTPEHERLVLRRDDDSATLYATDRSLLDRLLAHLLAMGSSTDSALSAIRQLDPELRQR